MFPGSWLEDNRVSQYEKLLAEENKPTAVSLSILDIKQPADWEGEKDVTSHWCLAHYLIDGHHKVNAAAKIGSSINLISFVALSEGVSSVEEVNEILEILAKKN